MPQSFHVVRCYKCKTFQVHIVKKSNKWQCKMCGDKQSIKKVFSTGTGSECRSAVQQLNLQIGLAAQLTDQSALDDIDRCPAGNVDNHPYEQSFADNPGCLESERMHPRNVPEQPQVNRWDAFLPQKQTSQIQFEPEEKFPQCNNSPDPPSIASFKDHNSPYPPSIATFKRHNSPNPPSIASFKHHNSPDPPSIASFKDHNSPYTPSIATFKRHNSPDPPRMASIKRSNCPDPQSTASRQRPLDSWSSSPQVSCLNPIKRFKTDPHLDSANIQRKSSFPKQTKSSFPNQNKSIQALPQRPCPNPSVAIPAKSNLTDSKMKTPSSTIQPPKSFASDFVKRYLHPLQNKPIPSKSAPQATVSKPTTPSCGNISAGPSSTTETSPKYSDQNQVPSPATSTATTATSTAATATSTAATASSSRWSKFLPTPHQDCE